MGISNTTTRDAFGKLTLEEALKLYGAGAINMREAVDRTGIPVKDIYDAITNNGLKMTHERSLGSLREQSAPQYNDVEPRKPDSWDEIRISLVEMADAKEKRSKNRRILKSTEQALPDDVAEYMNQHPEVRTMIEEVRREYR